MPRKTNSAKTTTAKTAKKAPRRSSSQFTPLEATAIRALGSRPTTVEFVEKTGVWVIKYDGKKAATAHSASGARRARARVEREQGYKLTPAKKQAAIKKYDKAREQ